MSHPASCYYTKYEGDQHWHKGLTIALIGHTFCINSATPVQREFYHSSSKRMQPLRYGVAQSLDGYIAPPDESTTWIVDDPSIDFDAIYASFDAFIMGRKTYEIVAGDGTTKNPLEGRPKEKVVVVSRTLNPDDHPTITVIAGGHIEHVKSMKKTVNGGIWLMGGGSLAAEFLAAGLLDGIDAAIMPVILGAGFKLITDQGMEAKPEAKPVGKQEQGIRRHYSLKLCSLERLTPSGILMTKYDILYD